MPRVTVLLPAYDCALFLREAVDSVLAQTLRDFELVVIDDGSTDGTAQVLQSYDDPRMVVLTQENQGMAAALNRGLALARGEYVARMDADDRSAPQRLERQVAFLDGHPEVVVVGSRYRTMDVHGVPGSVVRLMRHDKDLRREMYLSSPFTHGCVMLRRQAVLAVGGYDGSLWPAEDYDLWTRIGGGLANLPESLYDYREHSSTSSLAAQDAQGRRIAEALWASSAPPRRRPAELVRSLWTHRHELRWYRGRQRALRAEAARRRAARRPAQPSASAT